MLEIAGSSYLTHSDLLIKSVYELSRLSQLPISLPDSSKSSGRLQRGGWVTQTGREASSAVHWAAVRGDGLPVGFHSSAMSSMNRYSSSFHKHVGGVSWRRGLESKGSTVDRGGVCVYKSSQLRGRQHVRKTAAVKGLCTCSQQLSITTTTTTTTATSTASTQQPWLRDVFLSPCSAPQAGIHSATGTRAAASSTSPSACQPCLRTLPHSPAPTGQGTCGPPSWPRTWVPWCLTPQWCTLATWWPSMLVPCPARWAAACRRSSRPRTAGRCVWMSITSHLRSWWWKPRTAWWKSLVSF